MTSYPKLSIFVIVAALLSLAELRQSLAGSATWGTNPSGGDWNTAANWIPATVPNGPSDVARFGRSSVTGVTISSSVEVSTVKFNTGAPAFTTNVEGIGINLFVSGAGIMNGSGVRQSFAANGGHAAIFFQNTASAGNLTSFGGDTPQFFFTESASAGSANFEVSSNGVFQSSLFFWDNTTAANATIAVDFAEASFADFATAANAVFTVTNSGFLAFGDNATVDNAVATCIGGNGIYGSNIYFSQFATAAQGTFTAVGASTSDEAGSFIQFNDSTTAASGSFVINGSTAQDVAGAVLNFFDNSTAGNATITANGGISGGEGGAIIFEDHSRGGRASISLLGNGELDIGNSRTSAGVTIGSLAGDGLVFLGPKTLTIGSNNQSTSFSGVIQDGGINQGTGGSLAKLGRGTLTLTGANTYTGTTTVTGGALRVSNTFGSGTGTGAAQVNAGTLAGEGILAGPVTVGTGSGGGAFLAPSVGTNMQATLTIQSPLTFKADGSYIYRLNSRYSRADRVIANGVTIESGAQFSFRQIGNNRLPSGTVFSVINNSSGLPIAGVFANLPDNSIFTVGSNNYQASYQGGDWRTISRLRSFPEESLMATTF